MTNEVTNFSGKYFNLTDARNNPPPVQKPHPPICIGGNGEKRTLPNVARWAQHWNYAAFDFDGWVAKKAVLDGICHDFGRDPNEIMTSIHQSSENFDELEENFDIKFSLEEATNVITVEDIKRHMKNHGINLDD